MTTHVAAVDASHVQSRVVVTVSVPEAPAAGTVAIELSTDTWHLAVVGALTDRSDELHAAAIVPITSAHARCAYSRRAVEIRTGCGLETSAISHRALT
jgi:hypothetical protein